MSPGNIDSWEDLPPHIHKWTQENVFKEGRAQNYSRNNWTFYHDEVASIKEWLIPNIEGKVFFDVGCHIGIWSVIAALCGASEIYMFDINAPALKEAEENVKRVDSGAQIFSEIGAVGDQGDDRLRLDDYPAIPDFIKIDVEGMEMEVLEGARATIQEFKPMLMIENHCDEQRDQEILKMFNGYKLGAPVKDLGNHRHLFLINDI